jgi:NAD(P)-dependent dehydrogenase (short-subunit alcohol dehydrogenase family)
MDARTGRTDLAGRTTVVVGASRGLGRGIARAFAGAGAPVIAVARSGPALAGLAATSPGIAAAAALSTGTGGSCGPGSVVPDPAWSPHSQEQGSTG